MITPHLPTLGERLAYLRGLRGLTVQQAARAADMSVVAYRLTEFNLRTPTGQQVERLAYALRATTAFLLTGDLGEIKHFLKLQNPRCVAVGGVIRANGLAREFTLTAEHATHHHQPTRSHAEK
jgi:transcriptional regulator with XRE-family HTH domain